MVKSINLRSKFASENLSDRGFWDTLYVLNAMLTTLFRSQVIDITANALIEVNGISRARKNRSTYPKQLLPSPVSFLLPIGDLTKLSFLFILAPLLREVLLREYFVSRGSAVLRDVQSELPPPDYCTQFPPRMKIFSREEKVGHRTETDVSGSTSVPLNIARHKERSCINNL